MTACGRAKRYGSARIALATTAGRALWDRFPVEILVVFQHRLLAFVHACNGEGYQPTVEESSAWLSTPRPREEMTLWGRPILGIESMPGFELLEGAEPVVPQREKPIDHALRLGWLESQNAAGAQRLRLTSLGTALLRHAENSSRTEPELAVVVLGREDPLAYPLLIGRLAGIGDGLLVDPFLGVEQLHELIQSTQISRFLVSSKRSAKDKRAAMATYLRSGALPRTVDVRVGDGLHDRVVLADRESFTLGTSLNGVGRTTTVLTPLPRAAADALRAEMDGLWRAATQLVKGEGTAAGEDAEPQ